MKTSPALKEKRRGRKDQGKLILLKNNSKQNQILEEEFKESECERMKRLVRERQERQSLFPYNQLYSEGSVVVKGKDGVWRQL